MWSYWLLGILAFVRGLVNTMGYWQGSNIIPFLWEVAPLPSDLLPKLSIIVPALDEEASAESAMRTLLNLDYPDYEIIAVNDRSSDRTGEILDRLAAENDRLRVIHVKELPFGWLGKTHAMHLASLEATGDWFLFTDADVHFSATAMPKALSHAVKFGIDHLVVLPQIRSKGFWETAFLGLFWTLFSFKWKPRRVSDPRKKDYIGVGAFNLVKARAYRKSGGHAAMPLEVLDDLKLGKLLKRNGARQACLPAGGLISVRWIDGVRGAVTGLAKNMFAALGFNPLAVLVVCALLFVVAVWPLIGLFVGPIWTRLLCAAALAIMVWSTRCGVQVQGLKPYHALVYPISALVLIYITLRSMVLTYKQRGVLWRGTFYPLFDLRKGII
jgi:hypothetical protein